MLDTTQFEQILNILENLDDQEQANNLLKEFNDATSALGKLLMNLDANIDHEQWKKDCDSAQAHVDAVIKKIKSV